MEIGSVRPAAAGPTMPVPKAINAAPVTAEPTIESRKTVEPVENASSIRRMEPQRASDAPAREVPAEPAPMRSAAAQAPLVRIFEPDTRTGEFVYKKIDKTSGDVVEQVPQEVLLRMRAALASVADPASAARVGSFEKTA